ncbi:hypothetical protein JTY93_11245 [Pseudomonas hygromyciniae]|uniref:Uncharacterized protein n=1 Tax=Pseudomonas hygromyciniae TaxID=2812000 RepID=A0ABX7K2J8_9PSED|nr:hypothetical protein [Pseudomonas hygromyciniae]MBN0978861.1 hypothetical protein [Pseudomonas hygromyciniae]QSB41867.1 hypothetical protein JTY93_11245 [Pseudomonas hygromyciniae]
MCSSGRSLPEAVTVLVVRTKLLDAICGDLSRREELNRAGGKAEGFVPGLESTKAIKRQVGESLYVG